MIKGLSWIDKETDYQIKICRRCGKTFNTQKDLIKHLKEKDKRKGEDSK